MTETDVTIDLNDYTQILDELTEEIGAYGSERKSLNELTEVLRELSESNQQAFSGVEKTVRAGSEVLRELRDLKLADLQGDIGKRYETHQQSLKSVTETMQQIVHEQQRSAMEMLQNAQHNKQALESYAEDVKAANASREEAQQRISQQLDSITTEIGLVKGALAETEKQLQTLRILMIAAVVLVLVVGIAVVTI